MSSPLAPLLFKLKGEIGVFMISHLRLCNFQGFGQLTTIPLKPLTFIYGPNASGKSSILRALLLAKQSLPRESLSLLRYSGFDGFVFEGELVSLASFANVVYRHETSNELKLGFTLKVDKTNRRAQRNQLFLEVDEISYDWTLADEVPFVNLAIGFKFKFSDEPLSIVFKRVDGKLEVEKIEGPDLTLDLLRDSTSSGRSGLESGVGQHDIGPGILEAKDFRHLKFLILGNLPRVASTSENGIGINEGPKQAKLVVLDELVQLARFYLNQNLGSVRHIKPLRDIDNRFTYEGEDVAKELDRRLMEKVETIQEISNWITELTHGRYVYKTITYSADEVKYFGKMKSQMLVDKETNTPVSFRDVGVGLSQIKPVLEALASASANPTNLLLIEQPELHLHPRMQADLAGLLSKFVSSNAGTQIIAETHSEAMLLRIQKLLRDGVLDKNLVQILYADRSLNEETPGNYISAIDLAEDNAFDFELPLSFADLRFRDLI
jgi:predicted ATPase